jgi:hypothetical protein
MEFNNVPRLQALSGLSLMSLATLALHGVSKSFYSVKVALPTTQPISATQEPPSEILQAEAILASLDRLSATIAQANASLHSWITTEIQGLQIKEICSNQSKGGSMSTNEVYFLEVYGLAILWGVGLGIFIFGSSHLSQTFLPGTAFLAAIASNIGLAYTIFFSEREIWYVYILSVLWPMQMVMAVNVLLHRDTGAAREKEKK